MLCPYVYIFPLLTIASWFYCDYSINNPWGNTKSYYYKLVLLRSLNKQSMGKPKSYYYELVLLRSLNRQSMGKHQALLLRTSTIAMTQ